MIDGNGVPTMRATAIASGKNHTGKWRPPSSPDASVQRVFGPRASSSQYAAAFTRYRQPKQTMVASSAEHAKSAYVIMRFGA
jgi:hypothetical protein